MGMKLIAVNRAGGFMMCNHEGLKTYLFVLYTIISTIKLKRNLIDPRRKYIVVVVSLVVLFSPFC